jgi:hypothetical protein
MSVYTALIGFVAGISAAFDILFLLSAYGGRMKSG